jgi:hypothetical protein
MFRRRKQHPIQEHFDRVKRFSSGHLSGPTTFAAKRICIQTSGDPVTNFKRSTKLYNVAMSYNKRPRPRQRRDRLREGVNPKIARQLCRTTFTEVCRLAASYLSSEWVASAGDIDEVGCARAACDNSCHIAEQADRV